MISFNIFGFLERVTGKVHQLPNKKKSKEQIQCIKADHGRRTHTQLKEGKKRSEHISSFSHHR